MKNTTQTLIILCFLTCISFSSEAQLLKKIQNAANRGIERAIEKKVEDGASKIAERQIEKLFSDMYGDSLGRSAHGIDMSQIMKGLGEPVDTESEYSFLGHIVFEMTSTDEKGKKSDPVLMRSYLAETADYTGMEFVDIKNPDAITSMVFDVKNQASIFFLNNKEQKSSFAYKMNLDDVNETIEEQAEADIDEYDFSIEKTGKTKDILGYACEEYHVKSEDGEGYYWITEEPIGGYSSFWSSNSPMMTSKAQEKYANRFKNLPEGNFMELTYTTKESGTIEMMVKEIDESASKSFTMAEYPNIMNSKEQD